MGTVFEWLQACLGVLFRTIHTRDFCPGKAGIYLFFTHAAEMANQEARYLCGVLKISAGHHVLLGPPIYRRQLTTCTQTLLTSTGSRE
jgi:hypothetical protein